MIPSGVQIFVSLAPIDLRLGFDRLAGVVREAMRYEPRGGALYLFVGKRRTAVKVLFFDGSGMCLFYKRLDRGTFSFPDPPRAGVTHVEIDDATLGALLDGLPIVTAAGPTRTYH